MVTRASTLTTNCFQCGRQFIESYSTKGYLREVKENCLKMYINGSGFRAIERITGVNHNTVIRWVKKTAPPVGDLFEIARLKRKTLLHSHRRNAETLS